MFKKRNLTIAVASALGITSAGFYLPAIAQDEEIVLEEIIITGSRIKKTNLVSSSPVVSVGAEELTFTGTTRVEDLVRNLPQVWADQGTGQSNGATGTATLDLRNLGPERTLVLVNGRRLPAGSPIQGGVGADINQIPGALIKNIEVLTGGASAVYGSDAVAGVVDFQMVDDFEGVKLSYQFAQNWHDNDDGGIQRVVEDAGFPVADGWQADGDTTDISLIIGGNLDGGRGNVTAYATYRDIEGVTQAERDYSACGLSDDLTSCVGSTTIPEGRITDFDAFDYKVAGSDFVDRDGTTYNFGPLNYFQRPDERYTAGAFAHYEINEHVEAFSEFMFMDDRSLSQIAPSGAFFVTDTLNCGNPLLSAQQFDQLCGQFGLTAADTQSAYVGRRNVEGGNRQQDLRHTSFRGVFGLRGDINDAMGYEVSYQYSEVSMENTYLNDLSTTKIGRALNVVDNPLNPGEAVCQSVVDGSDPDCVPWNIFTTGAVTQAQTDYLVLPLFARGTTDQTIFNAFMTVSLGEYGLTLPTAETGIEIAFGYEQREENLAFNPDSGFLSGDGAGQGGATLAVDGGYDVKEVFVEASIPIVQGKPFAEEITLDLGYRYSDYSTDQETDTYGIRAAWAINSDVKLRASYQRAVRAANIRELFLPQGLNLFDMATDPCSGAVTNGQTAAGRTFEECALSGVTAAQFGGVPDNEAGQYNFLQGGQEALEPEEADTYSFGVVFSPSFVEGLDITVDYYQIEIEKGIDNLSPEFILNQCLDGNLSQCELVKRNANRGDLWIGSDVANSGQIIALNDNLAIEKIKGYDVTVAYTLELGGMGSLGFNNVLGMINAWDQTELEGAPKVSCKGKWGASCGYPTPDFRNNLRVTWTTPWDITASLAWRHTSAVDDLNENDIDLEAIDYFDVAGAYDLNDKTAVNFGITNVLDEAPPLAGGAAGPQDNANGNVFPGMYDALGRYYFVGVSLGF